ncbi:L,D-transpeptidase family protein [Sodalis sp. CWE]|uniref:L,D-transpeptidase family protein n=1 Tax=Sodalis sp. CWE TaxID=2803816 RepID=UPI001C7D58E1|nr:L,D-transpeptidase family protein [Sodalis sp. CWE]MBX4181035.1 L,D-transpeptidase family protein [Sodalis sp. CWE]
MILFSTSFFKRKRIFSLLSLVLLIVIYSQSTIAVIYSLPKEKSRLIGENLQITIPDGNKHSLEYFANQFQVGLSNILEANPGIDVYLPIPGTKIIIPKQLILPNTVHEGIIINNAEMRLFFYPKNTNKVVVLPIGIGEVGTETPSNWITSVQRKKNNPTWTPTQAMRKEYLKYNETLPKIFPAGPNNPMGLHALYVGRLYALHGTNANFGIGLRVSHGCVRLRAKDIKYLFDHVPIGTRVQFINEPIKTTIEPNNTFYIEVHNPLSSTQEQFDSNEQIPIFISSEIREFLENFDINQVDVDKALRRRSGMPEDISKKSSKNKNVIN